MALQLSAKRVEVLKELVPHATRMALLTHPNRAIESLASRQATDAGRPVVERCRSSIKWPKIAR